MQAESLGSRLGIVATYLLYGKLVRLEVPFAHYYALWYCAMGVYY